MKISRCKILIALLALVLSLQFIDCQDNNIPNDSTANQGGPGGGGVFNLFLKPIKAVIRGAKSFLGFGSKILDGFDEAQVKTFEVFMKNYNRTYNSTEEISRRMRLFVERTEMFKESVREFNEGLVSFIMGENDFIDWNQEELRVLKSTIPPKSYEEMTEDERRAFQEANGNGDEIDPQNTFLVMRPYDDENDVYFNDNGDGANFRYEIVQSDGQSDGNLTVAQNQLPASKDWRTSGCIAEPRNQLRCGCCYAVATIDTLETMRCINKKASPILSPQQVIDCSTPRAGYRNYGCDGGWPTPVLEYLRDTGVVAKDSCYPFVRAQQYCKLRKVEDNCKVSSSPTGSSLRYKVLNNEYDIQRHVANTGPVITVMKARDSFLFYKKGIYDDPECSRRRNDVDHAVSIVGYGRENGMDYWIIKNSWGKSWGENGYGKFRRGTLACSLGHWGWVITG